MTQPRQDDPQDWPLPPLLGEPEPVEVHEIHRGILTREKAEPREGLEPAPWWVWAASVILIFAMGFYLGEYGGSFSAETHLLEQPRQAGAATPSRAALPAPEGRVIYASICLPCHQAGGLGMPGKYPPLAGSEWVARDPAIVARIVLHGLTGPVRVKGNAYDNEMPALANQLDDAEIAAVLTYVRSSWGNQAGPVSADLVAKLRNQHPGQGPWTAAALEAK